MMAIDGEKLIEAAKKREVLYISTAKSYKDSNMKDKAWGEVATELWSTWQWCNPDKVLRQSKWTE